MLFRPDHRPPVTRPHSALDLPVTLYYSASMTKTTKRADGGETPVVAFRLPTELIRRLDCHTKRLGKQHPGMAIPRTDALRELLTLALDAVEQREG